MGIETSELIMRAKAGDKDAERDAPWFLPPAHSTLLLRLLNDYARLHAEGSRFIVTHAEQAHITRSARRQLDF